MCAIQHGQNVVVFSVRRSLRYFIILTAMYVDVATTGKKVRNQFKDIRLGKRRCAKKEYSTELFELTMKNGRWRANRDMSKSSYRELEFEGDKRGELTVRRRENIGG